MSTCNCCNSTVCNCAANAQYQLLRGLSQNSYGGCVQQWISPVTSGYLQVLDTTLANDPAPKLTRLEQLEARITKLEKELGLT